MKRLVTVLLACWCTTTVIHAEEPLNDLSIGIELPGVTRQPITIVYNNYYSSYGPYYNPQMYSVTNPVVLHGTIPMGRRIRLNCAAGFIHTAGMGSALEGVGQLDFDVQLLKGDGGRIMYGAFGIGIVPAWSKYGSPDWNPMLHFGAGGEYIFRSTLGLGVETAVRAHWIEDDTALIATDAQLVLRYHFGAVE